MAAFHEPLQGSREARERSNRVFGWLSGLGLLMVPVIVAGILATGAGIIGPDSWDAERTFPWLWLASLAAGLGWVGYGSARIRGFRRGALVGTAISLAVLGAVFLMGILRQ